MPTIIAFLPLFLWTAPGDQGGPRIIDVGTIQCSQLADSTGPWTIGRNVAKFVDSCVQWRGMICSKKDAHSAGLKEWVIPVDSTLIYSGSSILTLGLYGVSGVDPLSSFSQFPPYDFLCSPSPTGITTGMAVIITGTILGWSISREHSSEGKPSVRLLIGATGIRDIDWQTRIRISKPFKGLYSP
jgi:hypothetical protein